MPRDILSHPLWLEMKKRFAACGNLVDVVKIKQYAHAQMHISLTDVFSRCFLVGSLTAALKQAAMASKYLNKEGSFI